MSAGLTGAGSIRRCDFRSTDLRSARVQEELREHWREVVKKQPPAKREAWLGTQEAITALGARTCSILRKTIARKRAALAAGLAAPAWVEAWEREAVLPPGFELEERGRLRRAEVRVQSSEFRKSATSNLQTLNSEPSPHRHAVRLMLSRETTRNGMAHPAGTPAGETDRPIAGPGTRRWTPPQAVDVEDLLDAKSSHEAAVYEFPASPSADAIWRIRVRGATPQDGNW